VEPGELCQQPIRMAAGARNHRHAIVKLSRFELGNCTQIVVKQLSSSPISLQRVGDLEHMVDYQVD
jgi:hypothetical protein